MRERLCGCFDVSKACKTIQNPMAERRAVNVGVSGAVLVQMESGKVVAWLLTNWKCLWRTNLLESSVLCFQSLIMDLPNSVNKR